MSPLSHKNRTYLATTQEGGLVTVDRDGRVSVLAIDESGALVEVSNGEPRIIIEGDRSVTEPVLQTLTSTLRGYEVYDVAELMRGDAAPGQLPLPAGARAASHREAREFRRGLMIGVAVAGILAALLGGVVLGLSARPLPSNWAPAQIQRPAERPANVSEIPRPGTPPQVADPAEPARSIEEINSEKGAQLPPVDNTPPAQPAIELPTDIEVQPIAPTDEPMAPPLADVPTTAPTTAQPAQTQDQGTTQAPATTDQTAAPPVPTTGDVSAAPVDGDNPFGGRLEENQASALANQDAARADVAKAGPEAATAQLDQMKKALDLLQSGQKLPSDFVAQLPPEVAATLQERGVVMTPEETALASAARDNTPPVAIVRIPTPVIDTRRDADGIPDIPESNSWSVLGTLIPLPLPGGGEIRSPEDFKRFGLDG